MGPEIDLPPTPKSHCWLALSRKDAGFFVSERHWMNCSRIDVVVNAAMKRWGIVDQRLVGCCFCRVGVSISLRDCSNLP